MAALTGAVGDDHELSTRARAYANEVIFGEHWPLTSDHVDLDCVTFETSTRMQRIHGRCVPVSATDCRVRLSEKTSAKAGFESLKETIRHELVHVYQHQTAEATLGHGESFRRWVDLLDLDGRCSNHYERGSEDYRYTFHCPNCGFIGGRYRICKTVRAGVAEQLRCQACEATEITVRGETGQELEAGDL